MVKKLTLKYYEKKIQITPIEDMGKSDQEAKRRSISAPGRGIIEIAPPELSEERVIPGSSVTCKVTVRGKNIAQISSEVMLSLSKTLIGPVFRNYLNSPDDRVVNGSRHPRWSSDNFIEFEFIPKFRFLYCGTGFSLACLIPEQYGAEPEMQIWGLEGIYQRGGGEPFRAKFEFDGHGSLIRKTGFYPSSPAGVVSPFELFIEDGDTFEPYVTMLSKRGVETLATANPIMLGGGNLPHWEESETAEGVFHVGVLIEDFDGKFYRKYAPLTVGED